MVNSPCVHPAGPGNPPPAAPAVRTWPAEQKKGMDIATPLLNENKKDRGQRFCRRSRSLLYSILLNQSWDVALADPRMSVRHHQFRFPFLPLMRLSRFLTEKITFSEFDPA